MVVEIRWLGKAAVAIIVGEGLLSIGGWQAMWEGWGDRT